MIQKVHHILQEILTQPEKFNLTTELTKLELDLHDSDFLRCKINQNGYSQSNKNIVKITSYTSPKSQKEAKYSIGLCTYFKSAIPNQAQTIASLTDIIRMNSKYQWTKDALRHLIKFYKSKIST